MMRSVRTGGGIVLLLHVLLAILSARTARADEGKGRPLVLVLRPSPGTVEAWPEGTQAVVAELVAAGYELTLRATNARDRDTVLAELASVAAEERVLGAVVVLRDGDTGVAYVGTRKDGTVRLETGIAAGAVGEGELALRVTQILGPPRLDVPEAHPAPEKTPPLPPPPPQRRQERAPEKRFGALLALQAGLAWSSDLAEPLPIVGLTGRKSLVGPLSLDVAGWLALGAARFDTPAGSVDITSQELTLHLSFDPFRGEQVGLSLGLGGGVVWVHGDGVAETGFAATDDSTRVGILSARATAFFTYNDWSLLLALEPGVMLPAVSVTAGNDVARLGRPWTQASVGLGWNF